MVDSIPASFIASHPEVVSWFIGGLLFILVAQFAATVGWISWRFTKLEGRVDGVETTLGTFKEHVGAGAAEMKAINDRVSKHMDDEENIVWKSMREIQATLGEMKVENIEAHASIKEAGESGRAVLAVEVATIGTRQQGMSSRLDAIEPKIMHVASTMPNGELKTIAKALEALMARLDEPARVSRARKKR